MKKILPIIAVGLLCSFIINSKAPRKSFIVAENEAVENIEKREQKNDVARGHIAKFNFDSLKNSLGLPSTAKFWDCAKGYKALFYISVGKQDTFHYAIRENDSIFLWAIVKGEGVHLVQDL